MDRLTKWIDERWAENHDNDTLKWKNGNRACMKKLAQYEDTGLTPAEVAELAQAKEEFSHLQQENEQLKEWLRLAVEDMASIADIIANSHELLADGEDEVRSLHLGRCDVCDKNCHNDDDDSDKVCIFKWQHSDKMKGLN